MLSGETAPQREQVKPEVRQRGSLSEPSVFVSSCLFSITKALSVATEKS